MCGGWGGEWRIFLKNIIIFIWGGGHELKLGPVGGQNIISSSVGGCHKVKCQIFLGDRGYRLHLCKMSLAYGADHYMCYIYGCRFIFSPFLL